MVSSLYKQNRELNCSSFSRTRLTVRRQFKADWCKNKSYLPFDFLVNDKIIVELDGPQHFKQIYNWQEPKENLKMKQAITNGFSVIRLLQEDVWNQKLASALESIQSELYEDHRIQMNLSMKNIG